jgi:hypothetical protein
MNSFLLIGIGCLVMTVFCAVGCAVAVRRCSPAQDNFGIAMTLTFFLGVGSVTLGIDEQGAARSRADVAARAPRAAAFTTTTTCARCGYHGPLLAQRVATLGAGTSERLLVGITCPRCWHDWDGIIGPVAASSVRKGTP